MVVNPRSIAASLFDEPIIEPESAHPVSTYRSIFEACALTGSSPPSC
jgi:hypothetical protein